MEKNDIELANIPDIHGEDREVVFTNKEKKLTPNYNCAQHNCEDAGCLNDSLSDVAPPQTL